MGDNAIRRELLEQMEVGPAVRHFGQEVVEALEARAEKNIYCKWVRSFFVLDAKSNILTRSKYTRNMTIRSFLFSQTNGC